MALVENAEQQADRVTMEMSRAGVRAAWTTTGAILSKGSGSARAAVAHFQDAFRQVIQKRMTTGQVSLSTFAAQTGGAREVLNIDSRTVARELTKELRRYGVTFAVDRIPGGGVTYHVAGKDAQAVAHALDRAGQRADERAARNTARRSIKERVSERVEQKKAAAQQAPTFTRTPRRDVPPPTRGGSR